MFLELARKNTLLIHISPYVDNEDHPCYDDPTSKRASSASVLRPIEDAVPKEQGPKDLRCPVDERVETSCANVKKCGVIIVLL